MIVGISMAQCWFMSVMSCHSSGWVVRYPISWMMQPQWMKCNLAENKQLHEHQWARLEFNNLLPWLSCQESKPTANLIASKI